MTQRTNKRIIESEYNVTRSIFHSQLSPSSFSAISIFPTTTTHVSSSNGEISRTNESIHDSSTLTAASSGGGCMHFLILMTNFFSSSLQNRYNRLYPLVIDRMHYLLQHHYLCAWFVCSIITVVIEVLDGMLSNTRSTLHTASSDQQQRSDTVSLAKKVLIFVLDSVHKELVQIARDCDIIHNEYEQWEYDTYTVPPSLGMERTPSICDDDTEHEAQHAAQQAVPKLYSMNENLSRRSVDNLSELLCDMDELNELISPNIPGSDFDFVASRSEHDECDEDENTAEINDEHAFALALPRSDTSESDQSPKRLRAVRVVEHADDDDPVDAGYDDDDAVYDRLFDDDYVFEPMYLCRAQLIKRMEGKLAERSSVYEMFMRGYLFGHPAVSRQLIQRKRDRRRSTVERLLESHVQSRHKLGCWHLLDAKTKVDAFVDYYAIELNVRNVPTAIYALLTMYYNTDTSTTHVFYF
eukprot:CAMPEP_0197031940 /NCGR_PEP_ID=MMETSP1384-20130603/10755_1 /TAXON_ID=29189 /ORGANISM="Ammonia sp." /LENGTH=467 /DNA_ID=CAMNT_0042461525 /DNA_START=80 /DNA_END=1483 /DNA_ORIENTATION=+